MRTRLLGSGLVLCVLALTGCGSGENSVGETIAAPVDNIDKNVKYKQTTEQDIRKIGNANKDAVDKILNERTKK